MIESVVKSENNILLNPSNEQCEVNHSESNNILLLSASSPDSVVRGAPLSTGQTVICSDLSDMTMVQQSGVRKSYEENHNPSVIIENAQARYLNTELCRYANEVSPSASPVRYSMHIIQNSNHYLAGANNNNNYGNWNYDSSLDLRHKPTDIDKMTEKHHQSQHQHHNNNNNNTNNNNNNSSHSDNELIEQRNIIAANNFSDIQQAVDHHNHHNISAEAAVMRTGLLPMYSGYTTSTPNHHSDVGATANSTIDEVIADTLKDENCAIVDSGTADETSHYLTLHSSGDLHHLKDGSAFLNANNNNNISNSASSCGDSRSPTGLGHDDFDNNIHSFTNLTSSGASQINNNRSMYNSGVIGALQATNEHSPIIHTSGYDTGIHSAISTR